MWSYNFGPYLQHYSSPYYNPEKAHAYYEKTKQPSNKVFKKDMSNGGYSSPYYDPEKAHEYYERTKQLKGRKKGQPTLNDEGRAVAKDVKENINYERDARLYEEEERHRKEQEIRSDATKRTMEQHRLIMNQRITSIQNLIKRMPDNAKNAQIPKLKAVIEKLREDNDKKRKSIQEKYRTETHESSVKSKETKKQIREEAKNTYNEEYERILNTAKFQQAKKRRK